MRPLLLAIALFFVAGPTLASRAARSLDLPYSDGHARPRALLYNPQDRLLYVALSTRDQVAAIDIHAHPARVVAHVASGPFPQSLTLLPAGDVLVVCRYDAALGVIRHSPQLRAEVDRYRSLPASPVHGLREAAVHRSGAILVAAPAVSGVQVIDPEKGVVQTVVTGLSPRLLRIVPDPRSSANDELLLVSNFIEHSVDAFALAGDGRIGARVQRITTQAAVQDLLLLLLSPPSLLMLSHEDRAVDRSAPYVAGLDSVILAVPTQSERMATPFADPGPGHRIQINLSERAVPMAKLDGIAVDSASGRLAVLGAATDNLLLARWLTASNGSRSKRAAMVDDEGGDDRLATQLTALFAESATQMQNTGNNPVALTFLPDGRIAVANRLADTITLHATDGATETLSVGEPQRKSPKELGELLFFSRALVPHNVAAGERSLYACSACHDDGHVDGRLHPARQNRFFSMTKTCRGIGNTAPYLFLGEVADVPAFAANLVATHAQGSERGPGFDRYSTTLKHWQAGRRSAIRQLLSPTEIRAAMAAFLSSIPPEPSPFVPLASTALPAVARQGLSLFRSACARCHRLSRDPANDEFLSDAELERALLRGEISLTSPGLHDVGIKVLGQGGNNAPSLRGVWDNAPYFSDGSARTLDDVLLRTALDRASPAAPSTAVHAASGMPAEARAALLAFLRCL